MATFFIPSTSFLYGSFIILTLGGAGVFSPPGSKSAALSSAFRFFFGSEYPLDRAEMNNGASLDVVAP